MDWIKDLTLDTILKAFSDMLIGLIDHFSALLNDVFSGAATITQGDYVTKLTTYTFTLAISLLVLMAIAQLLKLYILPDSGDPEENISGFFIRLGKSAVLIACSTELCTIIVTFTNKIATDVLGVVKGDAQLAVVLKTGVTTSGDIFAQAIASLLIILAIIICMIIVIFQACKRGVELVVLQIVAPIFAVNYITTDKGLWNKWLQTMFSVSLTYVFQVAFVNLGLKFLVAGTTNIVSTIVGLAWIVTAISSPKLLKEFAYSTGTGSALKSAGSMAVRKAMKV